MGVKETSAKPQPLRFPLTLPRVGVFPPRSLVVLGALFALLVLAGVYLGQSREVNLEVDRHLIRVSTRARTVRGLVGELGVALAAEDRVTPAPDSPLRGTSQVVIERAQPVSIAVDGRERSLRSHAATIGEVLKEARVGLGLHDRVLAEGKVVSPQTPLAQFGPSSSLGGKAPLALEVQRAIWIRVIDDGAQTAIPTFAATVGRALYEAGIPIFVGDVVYPSADTPVVAGMEILLLRSKPVVLYADGRFIKTRTRTERVGELLAEQGIALKGRDYTLPSPDSPVRDGLSVQVIRRVEEVYTTTEAIPFRKLLQPDSNLELDQTRLVQAGKNGVYNYQYRIIYEDGKEVARRLEKEWVGPAAVDQVAAYGTKIVIREADTPDGKVQYWRKMRVLATSYNETTCDKPPEHPAYGITKLGWRVFKGVIAVDPQVISMESQLYVPGYGLGVAGDTGGMIKGLHIDLYFPVDKMELWYKWVDIYLLVPVPPASQIRWVLPGAPTAR